MPNTNVDLTPDKPEQKVKECNFSLIKSKKYKAVVNIIAMKTKPTVKIIL